MKKSGFGIKMDFGRRVALVGVAMLAYAAVIWLQAMRTLVVHGEAYRAKVENLRREVRPIEPVRGFIFADGGELLAGSLPEYDVFLDFRSTTTPDEHGRVNIPTDTIAKYFAPGGAGSKALANAYSDSRRNTKSAARFGDEVLHAYKQRKGSHLVLRALPYLDYKRLRQQPYFNKIRYRNGIRTEERAHRYRPYGERRMASATIGTVYTKTGIDSTQQAGHGLRGIEKGFDRYLAGEPGKGYMQKIRHSMTNVTIEAPADGANVHTTIDVEMQEILDYELNKRILELNAAEGWAAFVEVKTGKIRAISNLRREGDHCVEDYNHLFEDLVDPGSTFKTVSYMVLLENGKLKPSDMIDTGNTDNNNPKPWVYHGQHIRDDHAIGRQTAEECIVQSSNIGVAKATTRAYEDNPQAYLDAVEKIGLLNDRQLSDSDRAEIKRVGYLKRLEYSREFPGAMAARHRQMSGKTWSKVSLAQISYGYETQIPGIYMLQFYNAIANDGKMVRPYIVDHVEKNGDVLYEQETTVINRKICSRETLKAVRHALEGVVEHGTAAGRPQGDPHGPLPGVKSDKVKIAGKTGTAQRRNSNGQYHGAGHNVSFVGYFPADEPEYCGIVVINSYGSGIARAGGGFMAGPVFRHFAERVYARHCHRSLRDVLPDSTARNPETKRVANLEDVVPGRMPDVRGMGAQDALLMLESAGFHYVDIEGKGKVVSATNNGGTVTIKLKQ